MDRQLAVSVSTKLLGSFSSSSSSSSSSSGSSTDSSTTKSLGNNFQAGVTTRYRGCCKASCGWPGETTVTSPVETCAQDGVTPVGPNTPSGCNGGTAYIFNNQKSWNVSSTLSYDYAAAYITGESESDWCCACYLLVFTSGSVVGQQMIVQVTNKDGGFGQTYGGVSQRSDCANLPSVLQPGCYWRFDWFQDANNPSMNLQQVTCPTALTDNTQCARL